MGEGTRSGQDKSLEIPWWGGRPLIIVTGEGGGVGKEQSMTRAEGGGTI